MTSHDAARLVVRAARDAGHQLTYDQWLNLFADVREATKVLDEPEQQTGEQP